LEKENRDLKSLEGKRGESSEAEYHMDSRLLEALDATPFPIAVVDLNDDQIFYWSHSAMRLFGHTADHTDDWYKIAYPDPTYRKNVVRRWKPILKKASNYFTPYYAGEYEVCRKDGSTRICELYATFIPGNLIVTFNDITERKEIQEAAKENELKYHSILDNIYSAVFIKDKEGKYLFVNKHFTKIHSIGFKEIIGLRDHDLFPKEFADQFRKNDLEVINTRKAISIEKSVLYKDGLHRVISNKIPLCDLNKEVYGVCGVAQDITELKDAQLELLERDSRFKQNEAIANVGSWEWEIDSDTVIWSDELFRIFRIDPEEGAVSYSDHPKIYTRESMEILDRAVSHTLKTGEGYSLDLDIIRGDGEIGHCIAQGFAKKDKKEKLIKLYGSFQDITEREKWEKALSYCKQNPDLSLIFMDVKMPVMDGLSATRKIREFNKEIVIIGQSAYALEGDRNMAIAAGCNEYITKPINEDIVEKLLDKYTP
jgi:PAS domain S-box-containing protein